MAMEITKLRENYHNGRDLLTNYSSDKGLIFRMHSSPNTKHSSCKPHKGSKEDIPQKNGQHKKND